MLLWNNQADGGPASSVLHAGMYRIPCSGGTYCQRPHDTIPRLRLSEQPMRRNPFLARFLMLYSKDARSQEL